MYIQRYRDLAFGRRQETLAVDDLDGHHVRRYLDRLAFHGEGDRPSALKSPATLLAQRCDGLTDRRCLLPEDRPERAPVGMRLRHLEVIEVVGEPDFLHIHLVIDVPQETLDPRPDGLRHDDVQLAQWLANAKLRVIPRRHRQARDLLNRLDGLLEVCVHELRSRLGVGGVVDALRRFRVDATDECLVHLLGQERREGRQHPHQRRHHMIQRPVGGLLVRAVAGFPHATAAPADVPTGQVVPQRLTGVRGAAHLIRVQRRPDLVHRGVGAREHPPVKQRQLTRRWLVVLTERGLINVGVHHQEAVRVPQQRQPTHDVAPDGEAEPHRLVGRLGDIEPAHDVPAHLVLGIVEPDRISPALVHLPARLVEHLLIGQAVPVRRAPVDGHRHDQQCVEPEPNLLLHLNDHVRREPRIEMLAVGEVVKRRERHDPRVQPAVPDLGDATDLRPARRAVDVDGVDPRSVQLRQVLDRRRRKRLQFVEAADDGGLSAVARIERQRKPPESLP